MNIIIFFLMVFSLIYSFFLPGNIDIFSVISTSLTECCSLILNLTFITAFFCGIMEIVKDSKLIDKFGFLITKIINKLFKTKNKQTLSKIVLNVTSNIIGLGNAATSAGLMAMKDLDKENDSDNPSYDMCKLMILNTCSVQIIPTTIIALRASSGSKNPSIVILPVIITSFLGVVFGLLILKLIFFVKGKSN